MFFIVSKISWLLLQPSSLLLGGLIGGAAMVWRGRVTGGLRLICASLVVMMVLGFSAIGDILTAPLERRFPRAATVPADVVGVIVLGGAEDPNGFGRELMGINEAGERLTEALALALQLPRAKVIFSGGSGAMIGDKVTGAAMAEVFFKAFGIGEDRLILERRSRTTYENAVYSRDLLRPSQGDRYLLVTSAWHMPRAIGSFRAQGFNVVAWPVDFRAPATVSLLRIGGNYIDGLRRIDFIVKEYLGLVGYRISGRIADIFPAP